jgi:hypothetical protein
MKYGITLQARVIYRSAFGGDELPKGWRVSFVDHCVSTRRRRGGGSRKISHSPAKRWGQCWYSRRTIEVLSPKVHAGQGGWLHTLIHEFIHQRCPGLRHGLEFDRLIDAALARVWAS